ncbi:Transcription factor CBF/NF-Y/archaeal histone domain [Dillenia turbinata]|uniref:Transcription factor CBF/NF-Y/archaeal histone domain n=1 Tax=Dillenia turbinata TaxID=194707 RepID=A0AAN8UNM3_9MAGN
MDTSLPSPPNLTKQVPSGLIDTSNKIAIDMENTGRTCQLLLICYAFKFFIRLGWSNKGNAKDNSFQMEWIRIAVKLLLTQEMLSRVKQPFGLPSGSQTASQLAFLEKQWRRQEQLNQSSKIMKADERIRMISAEALIIFARACEMFIMDLTLRSWSVAEENRRRNDVKVVTDAQIACETAPVVGSNDAFPFYYGMSKLNSAQVGTSAMGVPSSVLDSAVHVQQPYLYPSKQMWQLEPQDRQPSSN